jgi:hypothetical protein
MTSATGKTPTASGISRLLAKAGFERSEDKPGGSYDEGFRVSRYRLDGNAVLVNWWADSAETEPGHARRREMLDRYEAAITEAGYAVETAKLHRGLPYVSHLIVTAKAED